MTVRQLGIAYFGNRYPDHARSDLREIAAAGATIVDHTFSEADLRWNPKTIRQLVAIGNDAGLTAWLCPWGLGGVFGGESPSYAVMENPGACQVDSLGNPLPALCLNQPVLRDLITAWLDAAAATGASLVTWDEPHLFLPPPVSSSAPWSCRCLTCRARFQKAYGFTMPEVWTPEVAQFQLETTHEALIWMIDQARARGLESAVILLPDETLGDQGWREIAAQPGVAVFGVSPYWVFQQIPTPEIDDFLIRWCDRVVVATAGLPTQSLAWVQAFSIPAGREGEITRGVEVMEASGIELISVWAFRACEAMSGLAPSNPALVWDTVLRAFGDIGKST